MRVLLATACTPDDRKTLCAARAVARRGVCVSVGSDRLLDLACWSASVTRRLRYPHPGRDPGPFARQLERLLAGHQHDVVLPTNDCVQEPAAPLSRGNTARGLSTHVMFTREPRQDGVAC